MPTRQIQANAILAIAFSFSVHSLLAQPQRTVKGNLNPRAQAQFDRGPANPETKLAYISVMLRRSAAQQQALDDLLYSQQDRNSPLYHHWLKPEEFAERFGASRQDIDKTTAWLQSSGFAVKHVARGRDFIVFSGTAAQVRKALGTAIHAYEVGGKQHYANVEEPAVPEELAGLVAGFRGLNDFRMTAPRRRHAFPPMRITGSPFTPDFYSNAYPNTNVLAPGDLATIYNVSALYKAGVDGSGQTIAVAGQTDIDMTDIEYFRKAFGLPFNDPMKILVPGSTDPGIDQNELGEADLDLEWSGAIAPHATILFVYSDDVVNSAFFAIDEALAPVLSFSYGGCELQNSQSDAQALAAEAQKAAAEGITWVVSAGDSGAAACESQGAGYTSAVTPLSVNLPAAVPYVTAVGGAEFHEGSGNYWASKLRSDGSSALSYVPESAWTDETLIPQYGDTGFAASGGGASVFFSKPSWQKGPGVPNNSARNVPDVAVTASWYHDPYALITGGVFEPNGGTSAAAPTFAAIVALVNQYTGAQGLGNINPDLYALAQTAPPHSTTSPPAATSSRASSKARPTARTGPWATAPEPVTTR